MTAFIRLRNCRLGELAMGTGKHGSRFARSLTAAMLAFLLCGATTALADHLSSSGTGALTAGTLVARQSAATSSADTFQTVLTRLQMAVQKSSTSATSGTSGAPVARASLANSSSINWNGSSLAVRQMYVASPSNQRYVNSNIFNGGSAAGNFTVSYPTGTAVSQSPGGTIGVLKMLPFNVGLNNTVWGPSSGTVKIKNTSNPLDLGGVKILTVSGTVVKDRVVTASLADFGDVLTNGTATATTSLTTPGTSSYYTSVNVAGSSDANSSGVSISGTSTLFNGPVSSGITRTLSGAFHTTGTVNPTPATPLDTTTAEIPVGGLPGESDIDVAVSYKANVGQAKMQSTTSRASFGPTLSGGYSGSTPYRTLNAASDDLTKGLYSQVTSVQGSGGLSLVPPPGGNAYDTDQAAVLDIRANNGVSAPTPSTLTMAWRTRTPDAYSGITGNESQLASDVVKVGGVALTGTGVNHGIHQTEPYVIAMKFSPDQMLASTGHSPADWYAIQGHTDFGLVYLDPGSNQNMTNDSWEFAWKGCFDPTTGALLTDAQQTFVLGAYDPSADFSVGTWGIDLTHDVAWAVVNFNGQFGVAPEPATWVMLLSGSLFGAFAAYRRRRAIKAAR
jgi:hypothetical protein